MSITRRELLLNLLMLTASLVAIGVLFEVGVRTLAPQTVLTLKGLYISDSEVGFRHRPGFVGHERNPEYDTLVFIDERGYRVPAEPEARAADAYRVVGLGDSFTFGSGVEAEEVYLERIEDLLRDTGSPGRPVQVVNAGVGGMGLGNEARLLETDGGVLQPDLVIVGFYVGNDVRDVMCGWDRFVVDRDGFLHWKDEIINRYWHPLRPGEIVRDGTLPERQGIQSTGALPIPFKDVLKRNLHSYLFLQRRYDALRARLRPATEGALKEFTVFNMEALLLKKYPPELDNAWDQVRGILAQMDAWTHERGARLVIVAIPIGEQIYPAMWEHTQSLYGLDPTDFDLDKPQRLVSKIGEELGVPVIDVRGALRDAAREGPELYYRKDIHWTPRGHDVAAHEIVRQLGDLNLFSR